MKERLNLHPFFWAGLTLVVSQVLTGFVASEEKIFLQEQQIAPPEVSLGIPLIYFFGAVVLLGLVLFLVPAAKLKVILKGLFALLFVWGMFIALSFSLPVVVASLIAFVAGLVWFVRPKVWLHNLLLLVSLSSMGVVFGVLLSPWTAIFLMLAISVYDVVAVRFGYMMWMVKRLSVSEVMPVFIFPRMASGWAMNIKGVNLLADEADRDFSILGGGDIGFPLLLFVSVYFAYGFTGSIVVAAFSLLGLAGAYGAQRWLLKGKPTPALPPIFLLSLMGFLITIYLMPG